MMVSRILKDFQLVRHFVRQSNSQGQAWIVEEAVDNDPPNEAVAMPRVLYLVMPTYQIMKMEKYSSKMQLIVSDLIIMINNMCNTMNLLTSLCLCL